MAEKKTLKPNSGDVEKMAEETIRRWQDKVWDIAIKIDEASQVLGWVEYGEVERDPGACLSLCHVVARDLGQVDKELHDWAQSMHDAKPLQLHDGFETTLIAIARIYQEGAKDADRVKDLGEAHNALKSLFTWGEKNGITIPRDMKQHFDVAGATNSL